MKHKVVIHAELSNGDEISESELRKIVQDLENRGFDGTYDRVPTGWTMKIFGRKRINLFTGYVEEMQVVSELDSGVTVNGTTNPKKEIKQVG